VQQTNHVKINIDKMLQLIVFSISAIINPCRKMTSNNLLEWKCLQVIFGFKIRDDCMENYRKRCTKLFPIEKGICLNHCVWH